MQTAIHFIRHYKYAFILLLQGIILYYIFKWAPLFYFGAIPFSASMISSSVLKAISLVEVRFAGTLSQLVNWVLLSLVYVVILIPIGLIRKIRKEKAQEQVHFTMEQFRKEDLEKPW